MTTRLFCYNPSAERITGCQQFGDFAVETTQAKPRVDREWWIGPDEDLGYVISYKDDTGNHLNAPERIFQTEYPCHLGFKRTNTKSEAEFVELAKKILDNQSITTGNEAATLLNANGNWTSWGALPRGMVLYLDSGNLLSYPGTGTSWFDLSGNENHGTLAGPSYLPQSGGVLDFDGINDAVTFDNPQNIPIGNDPYTISVWFKSDEMPSDRGFVGWGAFGSTNQVNAWRLRNFGGGVSGFRHYWWGNDLDYQTPMNTSNWYNAIAAYENGSRRLYLNNVLVAQDSPVGHNVPYATNLRIGVTAEFLNEWFNGKIGQVLIYKRQATVGEIQAIWESGKTRFGY
jgi:hypothetical protein